MFLTKALSNGYQLSSLCFSVFIAVFACHRADYATPALHAFYRSTWSLFSVCVLGDNVFEASVCVCVCVLHVCVRVHVCVLERLWVPLRSLRCSRPLCSEC